MRPHESPAGRPAPRASDRAFVVHFAAPRPGRRFEGRVEHLASGRSAFFSSLAALLAFFAEVSG
ncbi:MAG: hypothetical protein IT293_11400 [Deltaproteobacteria bacterium]|nr:hypothetical protein [Deltaproteobacteria bacterium]